MPYFKSHDQLSLHYRDWGTGRSPIVFVHGNNCDASFWEYHITVAAEQGHRTLAPDRRGHGRSDYAANGYDYATYASDLAALLEHVDLRDATLVGHSSGANVILRYLSQYGDTRVSAVVLTGMMSLAPIPPEERDQVEALEQMLDATIDDRPKYYQSVAPAFFGPGVSEERMNEFLASTYTIPLEIAVKTGRILLNPTSDNREDVKAIRIPTLIVHGAMDTFAPIESAFAAQRAIGGSSLITYERASHGLPLSEPGRFTNDVLTFIESTSALLTR
jgi:non-heme chloroperoxidase